VARARADAGTGRPRGRDAIVAADWQSLLERTYAAFNARDVDGVLAMMHPEVDWPNGMEGGRVVGHREVREYWTRQWRQIDPSVEPTRFTLTDDGRVDVEVRQVVRDFAGNVHHVYTFAGGLVTSMEIRPDVRVRCGGAQAPEGGVGP
jgi:ketosteroid isomerase-like protein